MQVWQWILSALVIGQAAQGAVLIRTAQRFRRQRRIAFRHGIGIGYRQRQRELIHAKRVELHDAQRLADERPDAGPSARVSDVMFHRRHDM
jgi:hypothetical protein